MQALQKKLSGSLRRMLLASLLLLIIADSRAEDSLKPGESSAAADFRIAGSGFQLGGHPFVIQAGEIHPARVPVEYWEHRLRMLRAMGMNSVSSYLFWNEHEPNPGEFCWEGQQDIGKFCRIAHELGLKVILRPGPYVCGEWDFGGLPWWLMQEKQIWLRSSHSGFMEPARRYFKEVVRELSGLQITQGGPIIMIQVENEYDGFGRDQYYISELCRTLRDGGIEVPLFTSEMGGTMRASAVPDLVRAVGFSSDPHSAFSELRKGSPLSPLFCSELYTGWFDIWGWPSRTVTGMGTLTNTLAEVLGMNASFSLYMAHGGTSFGFSAGANDRPFRPQPTSYDYGAPIDEAGRATPKFHAIRGLIQNYRLKQGIATRLPDIPQPNPITAIPEIRFDETVALNAVLPDPRAAIRPLSMEEIGQGRGLILYRTKLRAGARGELVFTDVRDFAVVVVDGELIGTVDRSRKQRSLWLEERSEESRLDIVVEAMGRVHFGPSMGEQKGITQKVELKQGRQKELLLNWEIFPLPLDSQFMGSLVFERQAPGSEPSFFRGEFNLATPSDTFLKIEGAGKGMVWINGRNLGRYWVIGPQRTLYVPGPWLKEGINELILLDLLPSGGAPSAFGLESPILNDVEALIRSRSHRTPEDHLVLDRAHVAMAGQFTPGRQWQKKTHEPVLARYVCLEAIDSYPGDSYATCAELQILDATGVAVPNTGMRILYASSEEVLAEDGSADRLLDGRPETFWHSRWEGGEDKHPHQVVLDLGREQLIGGVRYLPRQDQENGRIRSFRLLTSLEPFEGISTDK